MTDREGADDLAPRIVLSGAGLSLAIGMRRRPWLMVNPLILSLALLALIRLEHDSYVSLNL